ncbi:MAG: hypothetical protein HY826_03515 [Actinobacteria bacterium]|nr:hypothetical protein [Actinomycetota bacterium]
MQSHDSRRALRVRGRAPRPTGKALHQGYLPSVLPTAPNNSRIVVGVALGVVAAGIAVLAFSTLGSDNSAPVVGAPADAASTTISSTVPATDLLANTIVSVIDDTGTFSIDLPGNLQVETKAAKGNTPFLIPSIAASSDLEAYYADETTYGLVVRVVGPDIGSEVSQVVAFLEPSDTACKERVKDIVATTLGQATRVTFTKCGNDEIGNKVVMAIQLVDDPLVVGIRMQSSDPIESVQSRARAVLETIRAL